MRMAIKTGKAMNKTDAKKIASTITNQQLVDMLKSAKENIKDWTKRSSVNKSMTIGVSYNIFNDVFKGQDMHVLAKKNMIWEFGDFLPEDLKIIKSKRKLPVPHHQDPIFN